MKDQLFDLKDRLVDLWDRLRSAYWLLPASMTVAALLLAAAMLAVDRRLEGVEELPIFLYQGGPEGARQLLSTLGGSMITVAGVAFSVIMVALTQAASLFGHRLIQEFLRDRGSQLSLGAFVGTFVYCMVVLTRVRGEEDGSDFVPRVAVGVAVLLALVAVGVLVYFLHHTASELQWGRVIAAAGERLDQAIRHALPGQSEEGAGNELELPPPLTTLRAPRSGYVHLVEEETFLAEAATHDLLVRLHARPGDHVLAGLPLATLSGREELSAELSARLGEAVRLEAQPSSPWDVLLAVQGLVEMASRALSPGINNPLTAMTCIDRLTVSLVELAGRGRPAQVLADEQGRPRLRRKVLAVDEVVDLAFNLIRHHGAGSPIVPVRLLEALASVAAVSESDELDAALERHVEATREQARESLSRAEDRRAVENAYLLARSVLDGPPGRRAEKLLQRDELLSASPRRHGERDQEP